MFFLKIHGWLHPIPRLSAVIIICIPRLPAVIVICTEAGSVPFPACQQSLSFVLPDCQQSLSFVPRLAPYDRGWLHLIPRLPAVVVDNCREVGRVTD